MTRKEFEKRINTYVEPYIMQMMVGEINSNPDDLAGTDVFYVNGVVHLLEMARDGIFDSSADADIPTINRYLDGIMICWSEVIPRALSRFDYESEEDRDEYNKKMNMRGVQMQMIVDTVKAAMLK